jgi:hypothetical protein
MRRRGVLAALLMLTERCAPTPAQQAAALAPSAVAEAVRQRQSRRFDTEDRPTMLRAVVGTLQDLGYTVEETQAAYGVVVGSKVASGRIRVEVVVRPVPGQKAVIVRATFQSVAPRLGAQLAGGELLDDATLYQGFFEKLAQSVFLNAHNI